jgi:type II secretory ATPase GspE/PulE/Tfp pilus assembly ATPase PilB-like protein
MQALRMLIAKSYGMILFTGPTGSGKTSTIYACLKEPVFSQKNIITLEDPVEYELTGMCQVQIMDSIGLTFARGLRQVLRHDPDVVVVGEMRDSETAKIGVQAALTGHLLISTLHTNTVSEAFARLIDLGVEPFLIASSVLGVASQRLLRKICPHCKELDPKGAEKLRMIHLPFEFSQDISFHKGRGCDECNNTGYKGRTIVYDLLVVNEEIKRAVVTGESSPKIKSLAVKRGMRSIEMIAFEKVKQGITSVDEIIPLVSDITQQS